MRTTHTHTWLSMRRCLLALISILTLFIVAFPHFNWNLSLTKQARASLGSLLRLSANAKAAAPLFAPLTVTNTNDMGPGSLRQAIADAMSGDTISFDTCVQGTITLTSAELLIDKNLTITGPGANLLTVQRSTDMGTADFRIFHIQGQKTVTISGLTISNGSVPASGGGGIFNEDSTLTVDGCVISNNSANSGGGIQNGSGNPSGTSGATLNLNNTTVRNN